MNSYKIKFVDADPESVDELRFFGESQEEAIQRMTINYSTASSPVKVLKVVESHSESKADRFVRYTKHLSQIDHEATFGVYASVVEFWDNSEWKRLYDLTNGAYCFCSEPKVKRELQAIGLFAEQMMFHHEY